MRYILSSIMLCFFLQGNSQVATEAAVDNDLQRVQLPYNRFIQPAGHQILFGDASLEQFSPESQRRKQHLFRNYLACQ
jgi:hypothetical protein